MQTTFDTDALLRNYISERGFSDQERLPPERELAEILGVTRSQLRAGLDALESEGLLWRHVGKGTFYGPRPIVPPAISAVSDLTNPSEIMEARVAFEPELARLAALRASTALLSRMQDCIELAEKSEGRQAFQDYDAKLHHTIAEAAGNRMLLSLYESIHANRHGAIWGRLREQLLTEVQMKRYRQQHREIVEAISERNAKRSHDLMLAHIKSVVQNIFRDF